MTNKELIEKFFNKETKGHTNSLSIRDGVLYTYNTPLALWANSKCLINRGKYSVTSSKHRGNVVEQAKQRGVVINFVMEEEIIKEIYGQKL